MKCGKGGVFRPIYADELPYHGLLTSAIYRVPTKTLNCMHEPGWTKVSTVRCIQMQNMVTDMRCFLTHAEAGRAISSPRALACDLYDSSAANMTSWLRVTVDSEDLCLHHHLGKC